MLTDNRPAGRPAQGENSSFVEQIPATGLVPFEHNMHPHELPPARTGPGNPVWKRWLAPATLVLSDVFLVLLSGEVASILQDTWGRGELSGERVILTMMPAVASLGAGRLYTLAGATP